MSEVILHTEHLSKKYGPVTAITDINFSLEKGTIHAIIGANGAGKSTLVKVLFGEVLPTSGKIFVRGQEHKFGSPGKALRNKITMVSQDFGLVNSMTIAENLAITNIDSQNSIFFNHQQARIKAEKVLSHLSLKVDVNRLVGDLTVSEKQLLAIAKAFSVNSDILIFDEPTSVLDFNAFEKISNLIKDLKNAGKSIIYITHKLNEVFQLADFVTVLKDGEIVFNSKVTEVSKEDLFKHFNIVTQESLGKVPHINKVPILRVDNISTSTAKNISFSVFRGEALGIVSENHTSLNELVKAIYGITKIKKGTIRINEQVINSAPSVNVKNGVGFITEDRRTDGIFNNLDINENIGLMQLKSVSRYGAVKKNIITQNSLEKIKKLGIKCESIFQPASELSGGNQQKVLFARWMSYEFDLLILLEPTSGIDLGGKSEIHSIISDLKKAGKSFLIVTSDSEEINSICDRVINLDIGHLFQGNVSSHSQTMDRK